ncbi:GNAT family N-acetyltransferase [Thermosipho atlanticus]|uniref:Acetyltransferase (GNAT) family protein n=1 Tax=Thermosipho atlanticus DSM 15807 TaxID=1123380 RepID=A0A1M5S0L8_9BACT|nr:GNAT family N-acetyltransferase [Thermosipho atlanticus]SHH32172.1 Acetyltransferase (GNAT) family protein [Thermosipho atlanticus DSM 15807]
MIRKVNKKDDLLKVAELIYSTDEELFSFLFGKKEKAIFKLARLVEKESNVFSCKNIYGYFDKELKGILIVYDLKSRDTQGKSKDFMEVFSLVELFILFLKSVILKNLMSLEGLEGLYIQNISVDKRFRGQGLGTKLLEYCIRVAKKEGYKEIYLDVEKSNRAKNLYLRKGFKIIDEKRSIIRKFSIYRMKKDI